MAADRFEPTIGSNNTSQTASLGNTAYDSSTYTTPVPVTNSGGGSTAWLVTLWLVTVLVTAAGGFFGWQAWQQQQQLIEASRKLQSVLNEADRRLQSLEERLDFSNEESSQSVEAIRAKLKWADSEIRKVWGVAYDRNRKAIKQQDSQLKRSKQQIDKQTKALAQLQQTQKTLTTQLTAAQQQVTQLKDTLARQDLVLDQLRNGLLERVQQNEDALDSINTYRRSTNKTLLDLKRRIERLQQQVQDSKKPTTTATPSTNTTP